MHAADCIFCKIERREIPAFLIFEDEHCLAFLDIRQTTRGHTLLIPRLPVDHMQDLPDYLAAHLFLTAQKIARHFKTKLDAPRVGYAAIGFGVAHAHLHIVPLWDEHDITSRAYAAIVDGSIEFSAEHLPIADNDTKAATRELLKLP